MPNPCSMSMRFLFIEWKNLFWNFAYYRKICVDTKSWLFIELSLKCLDNFWKFDKSKENQNRVSGICFKTTKSLYNLDKYQNFNLEHVLKYKSG